MPLNHGWNMEQPQRFCVSHTFWGDAFTFIAGGVRLVSIRVSSVFHPWLKMLPPKNPKLAHTPFFAVEHD